MNENYVRLKGAKFVGKTKVWFLSASYGESCKFVEYCGNSFVEVLCKAMSGGRTS